MCPITAANPHRSKLSSNKKTGRKPFNTSPINTIAAYFFPMVLITFEVPGFPLPEEDMSNLLYFATIYAKFMEPIR